MARAPKDDTSPQAAASVPLDLRRAETVDLLREEVLRTVYADVTRAERLAQASIGLANDLNDAGARASGLRALGHVSYARAHYEDAVQQYSAALDILLDLGRELDTGRTVISILQPLIYLGRYDEAYAWAARAKEIFLRLGDELRLARLASNLGNICYRQDRYAEALATYEEAYTTLLRLGEERDVAAVLSNIAVCNISLGRFSQALESYGAARESCVKAGLPVLEAGADYNIAYLHYLQADYLRAIELYRKSRQHASAAGDAYHEALCDLDEAEIYLELNLNAEAVQLVERARIGFEKLAMPYERAKATVIQAIATSRRGQTAQARRLFTLARKLFAAERNLIWPALIDLRVALLLERANSDRQAARLCRRACSVLARSVLPAHAALADLLRGRLALKTDQIARARGFSANAFARLKETGTPSLRFHAYFLLGQVEEASGNPAAAYGAYRSARLEIEAMRSRLWADEPKIAFLTDKLGVYESLVRICLAEPGVEGAGASEAFGYIQQAKSRSLADLIAQPSPPRSGPISSDRQSQIEEARRNLNSQYRHMESLALSAEPATAAQLEALTRNARECEHRLAQLLADIPASDQPPSSLDANSPSLHSIQAAIPQGAALAEYYIVDGVLHAGLVDRSGLEFVRLGSAEETRGLMRLLRFQMSRFRLDPDYRRAFGGSTEQAVEYHLRELYDRLFAPIRKRLRGIGHLIVAPHDFLHRLPFHALLGPDGYVIDQFTVSYAPSATIFRLCSSRRHNFGPESLVLGVSDSLAPHIDAEARAAAAALPMARLFQGAQASYATMRELAPASRFIHIATHGMFRSDNPMFSAIRLADSHLTLIDLYRLPLSAELVTLSGCSTGLNAVVGADELLGLMRGVLLAGAHGVMVSLWDVNDSSTAEFMKLFYQHLPQSPHKAAALQTAVRDLRRQYSQPYYWAPFLLAGAYGTE